jgi:predicted dehydrogenase
MTASRPYRTVLVGFGAIADTLGDDPRLARHFTHVSHAQVLSEHPAFSWEAVVDPDPAARERAMRNWSIRHVAASVEELAKVYEPTVAVIASPPSIRMAALSALPSLKAVLMEKPVSVDAKEARAVAALCRRRKLKVQVNYWRRADADMQALADGGLEARIGALQAGLGLYGNGLFNNGAHLVDLVRCMLGEIATVRATGPAISTGPLEGDVQVPFTMTLENGAAVALHPVDFRHYRENWLDLWGTQGRLSLSQGGLVAQFFPVADNRTLSGTREIAVDRPEVVARRRSDAFMRLADNLRAALEDREVLLSPLGEVLASEAVLHAVVRSASGSGRQVVLKSLARTAR